MKLKVPTLAIIIGERLEPLLSHLQEVIMENAIYSVISPEGVQQFYGGIQKNA